MTDTAGGFQFVSVGNSGQPQNANDRKTIRKAAMLAFRRRERIERVKAFAAECAADEEAKTATDRALTAPSVKTAKVQAKKARSNHPGPVVLLTKTPARPRLRLPREKWSEKSPINNTKVFPLSPDLYRLGNTPPPTPEIPRDLGHLNAFSCGDGPDDGYLFDYFISEIIPIMMPFDGHNQRLLRIYWSKSLMKDPVVLQAALSHAAVHMDAVKGKEPSKLAILHTKNAIRLINEKLASKDFVVSNPFIEAVAMIASNSNLTGDLAESQIHMDALQELVRLKGGKDQLGSDRFIHAMLSWSDSTSASIGRSNPRFATAIKPPSESACHLAAVLPPLPHIGEIFGLVDDIRNLTILKQTLDQSSTSTLEDIMDFDAQRNAIEGQIISLQYTFSTTRGLGFGDIFLDACCIATTIYMSLAFRRFQPNFPNLRSSKHDLMGAILKAEGLYASLSSLPESGFPFADILMWVLVLGGSLASNSLETTWFANRLALVVPWTQVRSWEEAEVSLKGVLWVDKLRNDACKSVWDEMESILGFKVITKLPTPEGDFDPQIYGLEAVGID